MYHPNYYKLLGINLWRQTNMAISLQINFIGTLGEDGGVSMFFITENHQKITLNFSLDLLIVTE